MQDTDIKQHVQAYYSRLFQDDRPNRLPIKTGRALAEDLGYPVELLAGIDDRYWENFLPCGNPFQRLIPSPGDKLLDLGCGAAIDSFVIQAKFGFSLEIVNLDVVFSILKQASAVSATIFGAAGKHGQDVPLSSDAEILGGAATITRQRWVCGDGEELPLRSDCFDWVLMNGALNLFPQKSSVLREVRRVLKPSGLFVGADLCAAACVPELFRQEKDAWAWCISGACTEEELVGLFQSSGFRTTSLTCEEERDMFYRISFSSRK